ncbi:MULTISPECIES: DUF732 domain-containing protein [unclassified Mycobacterium]|uniref:DUF732 domain-containing protein n=1 Tax=unclassified Mycobacterium TaxID=2642494 RepID=UPI0029C7A929|nr:MULTISPECIES: DUF732 domain-containing protein [unclassified Mycobacterium]
MFTTRCTKSIAGTMLAAGMLGLAVMAGAGSANADTVDDTYVAALAQAGIPQISPAAEISAGHAVCQNLDEGTTTPDRVIAAFAAKHVFATRQQDEAMVTASMTAYCPQYLGR